ncbi:hypothetical protein HK100_003417 [Physocladia obscura]|uniref:NAD(P)-binding protein n=1 Tax=Physocladia obscura TaxID=109957 RepID=A0AAD5SU09_9FUNG|nr:hypothetical protein HK100_003417 [Physocladia obscura]
MQPKVVCVVGGTSGLGAAVAKQLGATLKPVKVFIAGRTLPQNASPESTTTLTSPRFEYARIDVTSMKQCIAFADAVAADPLVKEHGLSALVLSAGNLNFALSRHVTPEGLERTFALNYLSKFAIINRLMPALLRANSARIVSVLAGGNGGYFDINDIQMQKGSYNCIKQATQTGVLVDLMTVQLSSLYSQPVPTSLSLAPPRFYHFFPGIMNTNNPTNANLPWYITTPLKLILPLVGQNPDVVARTNILPLLETSYLDLSLLSSGSLIHPGLKLAKHYDVLKDTSVRERLWEESKNLVDNILLE